MVDRRTANSGPRPRQAHFQGGTYARERRAQLVGHVGGEGALARHGLFQTAQQLVQPAHDRHRLGRHALEGKPYG